MIINRNLLTEIAKQKKYTFISTGMCTFKDIDVAVKIFKNINVNLSLCTAYPLIRFKIN